MPGNSSSQSFALTQHDFSIFLSLSLFLSLQRPKPRDQKRLEVYRVFFSNSLSQFHLKYILHEFAYYFQIFTYIYIYIFFQCIFAFYFSYILDVGFLRIFEPLPGLWHCFGVLRADVRDCLIRTRWHDVCHAPFVTTLSPLVPLCPLSHPSHLCAFGVTQWTKHHRSGTGSVEILARVFCLVIVADVVCPTVELWNRLTEWVREREREREGERERAQGPARRNRGIALLRTFFVCRLWQSLRHGGHARRQDASFNINWKIGKTC